MRKILDTTLDTTHPHGQCVRAMRPARVLRLLYHSAHGFALVDHKARPQGFDLESMLYARYQPHRVWLLTYAKG